MATNFDEIGGDATDKCFVMVGGESHQFDLEQLNITIDTPSDQILEAVQGVIDENMSDEEEELSFMVTVSTTNRLVFVYPKTPAGI